MTRKKDIIMFLSFTLCDLASPMQYVLLVIDARKPKAKPKTEQVKSVYIEKDKKD